MWQGSRALSCGWDTAFGLGSSGFMIGLDAGDLFQPKWDYNSKFRAEEKEYFVLSIPLAVNTTPGWMSLVPFPTTSPWGTHSLLNCVSALNEGSDCTSRRSDLLPPKCLCRENSGIRAGLFLTLTWQKEKMNTPKHAWAQGARLTALCQSHLIFKLLGLSVEGMGILLMYPTGWCCLWQISFWCQKPKYSPPFPLHKLLSP